MRDRCGEHVPFASARGDQGLAVGFVELAAEPLDHDVDHVRHGLERRIPNVLGDGRAADDPASVQDQELEKGELPRGQL